MVRHLFRLHPQESPILYWPSCKIHSLEVCLPCPCVTSWIQLMIFAIRQTVFYTPNTITISEGETIEGTLSCAPNARNNRDLDITIGWTAPHGQTETVNYKMCVIPSIYVSLFSLSRSISTLIPPLPPSSLPTFPSINWVYWNADQWLGRNIIWYTIFYHISLKSRYIFPSFIRSSRSRNIPLQKKNVSCKCNYDHTGTDATNQLSTVSIHTTWESYSPNNYVYALYNVTGSSLSFPFSSPVLSVVDCLSFWFLS